MPPFQPRDDLRQEEHPRRCTSRSIASVEPISPSSCSSSAAGRFRSRSWPHPRPFEAQAQPLPGPMQRRLERPDRHPSAPAISSYVNPFDLAQQHGCRSRSLSLPRAFSRIPPTLDHAARRSGPGSGSGPAPPRPAYPRPPAPRSADADRDTTGAPS